MLFYTNVGVSMMPLIREGRDVMVIERCRAEDLKLYDAAFFRRPGVRGRGEYVLHRVLKRNADGSFWIVGDNCTSGENVAPENILGRLSAVRRDGRLIEVTDPRYRRYVRLWCAPYRLRFAVLRMKYLPEFIFGWLDRRLG